MSWRAPTQYVLGRAAIPLIWKKPMTQIDKSVPLHSLQHHQIANNAGVCNKHLTTTVNTRDVTAPVTVHTIDNKAEPAF